MVTGWRGWGEARDRALVVGDSSFSSAARQRRRGRPPRAGGAGKNEGEKSEFHQWRLPRLAAAATMPKRTRGRGGGPPREPGHRVMRRSTTKRFVGTRQRAPRSAEVVVMLRYDLGFNYRQIMKWIGCSGMYISGCSSAAEVSRSILQLCDVAHWRSELH